MFNFSKNITYLRSLFLTYRLISNTKLTEEVIKDKQFKKLKKLLIYAYQNIPFYRERMDSVNFSPFSFSDLSEFQKIPELTKAEYKAFVNRQIEKEPGKYEKLHKDATSGSTGQPLKVYRTWKERSYTIAKWLRPVFLNGYSFSHRIYYLPSVTRVVKRDSWIQKLGIGVRRAVTHPDTVENMIEGYIRTRPDFFYGNKSQLLLMAQEILRSKIKIEKPKIYAVTGETIDENSKKIIQKVFGESNMFEVYGAVELGGVLAYQIKGEEGLHFNSDLYILELDDNGFLNKEKGNCIVTDLHTRSFPLIRYRLGDFLEMESANTKFPKIKHILGREYDWILLPNGRKLFFHPFRIIVQRREEIDQFRVIQKRRDLLELQYVLSGNTINKEVLEKELREDLNREVSSEMNYILKEMKELLPGPNGKFKMLINEIEKK